MIITIILIIRMASHNCAMMGTMTMKMTLAVAVIVAMVTSLMMSMVMAMVTMTIETRMGSDNEIEGVVEDGYADVTVRH